MARLRLRVRLLLLGLASALLALVILFYLQHRERDEAVQEEADRTVRAASVASARVDEALEGASRLLATLGAALSEVDSREPACRGALGRVLDAHPGYVNLVITDPDGSARCSALPLDTERFRHNLAWLPHLMRHRGPVTGPPQKSATNGKRIVVVAQPVFDSRGQIKRIIAAGVLLDPLSELLAAGAPASGAPLTESNSDSIIIARWPLAPNLIGRRLSDVMELATG